MFSSNMCMVVGVAFTHSVTLTQGGRGFITYSKGTMVLSFTSFISIAFPSGFKKRVERENSHGLLKVSV